MEAKRPHLCLRLAVASLCFYVSWAPFLLEGAGKPELEDLMKDNGKAFSVIEKGIAKGKFEGLPEKAQGIADRSRLISQDYEPPIHKEDIEKFRSLSLQLLGDAQRLKTGLVQADSAQSKKLLKELEVTCISCHKAFVPKKKR